MQLLDLRQEGICTLDHPARTVPAADAGEELALYTFNTNTAKHYFCPRCGVASFYIARSAPDKIDVNLRCVEGIDLATIPITQFDGRNWETARAAVLAGHKPQ